MVSGSVSALFEFHEPECHKERPVFEWLRLRESGESPPPPAGSDGSLRNGWRSDGGDGARRGGGGGGRCLI